MSIHDFLQWEAQQPGRFEFIGGEVIAVADATQEQSLLKTDLISALRPLVRGASLHLLSGIRLPIPVLNEVWYPAVIVDAGPFSPDALEPSCAILVMDIARTRVVPPDTEYAYVKIDTHNEIAEAQDLLRELIESVL